MGHPDYTETSQGQIPTLILGTGNTAVTIGGAAVLPASAFDGDPGRPPAVALEVADVPPSPLSPALKAVFGGGLDDPLAWLKKGLELCRPDLILLRLSGGNPEIGKSPLEETKLVEKVMKAAGVPLIVVGSGHLEGDVALFKEVTEVLRGTGTLIGKAQDRNYRSLAAIAQAADLPLITLTDLDVNLCKQLNILLTQAGFPREKLVIDPMASALGYGFEYTYSVMERIRIAALRQGDEILQCPIILDLGEVVGKIKEALAPEDEVPEWGPAAERFLLWESAGGAVFVLAGADIISVRNPAAVEDLKTYRDALWGEK